MSITTIILSKRLMLVVGLASLSMALPVGAEPPPKGYVSPLATVEQNEFEQVVLRLLADPRVLEARKHARTLLAASPIAKVPEAQERIDHTLDAWVTSLAFQEANADPALPSITWNTSTSVYSWFGHTMPAAGLSGDNPDNIYRSIPIDGSARYVMHGKLGPRNPAQFMFELVRQTDITPAGKDNITLAVLSSRDLNIAADGTYTVSVDSDPANGRKNHLQSQPGPLLRMIVRDSLSNWLQSPNSLTIKRLAGGQGVTPPNEAEMAGRVADKLDGWVTGWLRFIEKLSQSQPQNALAPPYPRSGGWGYLSTLRFHLGDDEAIVLKTDDGAAEYAALQVTDVWTIAPDPQKTVASYTSQQSRPDADGTHTYVISTRDPGTANWVDTAGIHQGWIILRWQGLPRTRTSGDGLFRDFRIVKINDLASILPADARGVTPEQRRQEHQDRIDAWRLRIATGK
jgi:hypothetical protein